MEELMINTPVTEEVEAVSTTEDLLAPLPMDSAIADSTPVVATCEADQQSNAVAGIAAAAGLAVAAGGAVVGIGIAIKKRLDKYVSGERIATSALGQGIVAFEKTRRAKKAAKKQSKKADSKAKHDDDQEELVEVDD